MLNIKEFKAAVNKYDLERPNLFAVEFSLPDVVREYNGLVDMSQYIENGKLITLFCKGANLPGTNLSIVDNRRYGIGPNVRMPVAASMNDISLTFLSDSHGRLHLFFSEWINRINPQWGDLASDKRPGEEYTYEFKYKKTYETSMEIITYSGEPGKTGGSGILQTVASVASAAAGIPFLGSLLGSAAGPQHNLVKARSHKFIKIYPTSMSDISLSSSRVYIQNF